MTWSALGDWGTTRLRLFRVEDGRVTDRVEGPGALSADPEGILRTALATWSRQSAPAFVHLSGMAGARTGLREAPYVDCPADASTWARSGVAFTLDGVPVRIAAGLACVDADGRSDLMRGEETQIFGALELTPDLSQGAHLVLLPGTHSKWAWIEDGRVVRIRTFITGEMFAVLQHSSLLAAKGDADAAAEEAGFDAGLVRARQTGAFGALFEARSAQLRHGRPVSWARGFISGLLIGAEIAEMRAQRNVPSSMTLIGAPGLTGRYAGALARDGASAREIDGDTSVLAGLRLLDAHN